jgi:preprotein translocase subunit SecD
MNEFPRWKYALVVLALLFGFLYALPNMYPKQPAVQVSANRGFTVDGVLKEKVQGILETQKIAFNKIELEGDRLLVRLPDLETQTKASDAIKGGLDSAGYVIALNLASTVPAWLTAVGAHGMAWGLDLQGGVHFLMEVDQKSVVEKQEQHYTDEMRSLLRTNKISNGRSERGAQGIVVTTRSAEDRATIAAAASKQYPELIITDGASTGDAYTLIVKVRPEKLKELALNTIRQNVGTLRNRINELGVAEPIIQQQGDTRIVVELPGLQDTAAAKKVLGATATLEYRAVDMVNDPAVAESTGRIPPDSQLYHMRDTGAPILLKKKIIVSGDELVDASAQPDQRTGTPAVHVTLNTSGGNKMLDFTMNNVGKRMAVVYVERIPEVKIVDGKEVRTALIKEDVVSDATIQGVFSRQFQTTGLGSMKDASETALFLRAGSLAAPIDIVEERVIGPSLGQDNIAKGLTATLIGVTLVIFFVGLYYKLFGLIADVALILNLVLLVAILSLVQATLTLPAIAGIVLTLGMAIDANVLICERIREEMRNGSTPMASIKGGYDKAWATILDANVTHLIAAFGLMAFGSGPIRGFAITLAIGIVTSMFTSVTVTHVLVGLVFGGRRVKSLSV